MDQLEKELWRLAGVVTVAAAVIAFALYVYMWKTYYSTLPSLPDRTVGRIYVDNFHGFPRYESREEYIRLHSLGRLSEALVFGIMVGVAIYEWRVRVKRETNAFSKHTN